MSSAQLTVVQGDTAPSIFGALTDSAGDAVDLTDASAVRLQVRQKIDRRFFLDGAATIVDAATGSVRYDLQAGDLPLLSTLECVARWRIEWDDGSIEHTDPANTIDLAAQ